MALLTRLPPRSSLVLAAALAAVVGGSSATAAGPGEYEVKAAFLYNFAKFVEWPDDDRSDERVIVFGVLGVDPFGGALEAVVDGKSIRGRRLVVERYEDVEEAKRAHVLFISDSESYRLDEVLREIERGPTLTVGESDRFAESGGIIELFLEGQRVRFEVNPGAAADAGLRISSELLKLARSVISSSSGG